MEKWWSVMSRYKMLWSDYYRRLPTMRDLHLKLLCNVLPAPCSCLYLHSLVPGHTISWTEIFKWNFYWHKNQTIGNLKTVSIKHSFVKEDFFVYCTFIRRATRWWTVSLSTPSRSMALCRSAAKLLSSSVNSRSCPPLKMMCTSKIFLSINKT